MVNASIRAGRKAPENSHLLTSAAPPKKTIAKKSTAGRGVKKNAGAKLSAAAAAAAAAADGEEQQPTVQAASDVGGDDASVCVDAEVSESWEEEFEDMEQFKDTFWIIALFKDGNKPHEIASQMSISTEKVVRTIDNYHKTRKVEEKEKCQNKRPPQ